MKYFSIPITGIGTQYQSSLNLAISHKERCNTESSKGNTKLTIAAHQTKEHCLKASY
jgi:hypothetical protein